MHNISPDVLIDLVSTGRNHQEIAGELGVSSGTISKRLADLRKKQGLLTRYKEIQHLHLTELQARCLEAITPEKIAESSFLELVRAFKILKDKEEDVTSKNKEEVGGLLSYLLQMEKDEIALKQENEDLEDQKEELEKRVKLLDGDVIEVVMDEEIPNI